MGRRVLGKIHTRIPCNIGLLMSDIGLPAACGCGGRVSGLTPPPPTPPLHLLPRSPFFLLFIFPALVSLIAPPLIPGEMADGGFTAPEAWIVFPSSRSRARQLCPQCPSLSVTVMRLLRYESQRRIRANSPGNKVGCGLNRRGGASQCCIFMTTVPAGNRDGFSPSCQT